MTTKSIRVPREFFVKERKQVYSNWTFAFFRELVQNSVDAGASRITIDCWEEENTRWVRFADNGRGMTREVLDDVYMALGRSTKDQAPGSIGGFGRARILTCFSHLWWQLRSKDWVATVEADGVSYTTVTAVYLDGMSVEVKLDCAGGNWPDTTLAGLKRALMEFLDLCYLPWVRVTFNGEEIPVEGAPLGELLRPITDDVDLHDSPSRPRRMIVQVNGLCMFTEQLYKAERGYIINLDPLTARTHLSASRDALTKSVATEWAVIKTELEMGKAGATMKPLPALRRVCRAPGGAFVFKPEHNRERGAIMSHLGQMMQQAGASTAHILQSAKFNAGEWLGSARASTERMTDVHQLLPYTVALVVDTNVPVLRARARDELDPFGWRGQTFEDGEGRSRTAWGSWAPYLLEAWMQAVLEALGVLAGIIGVRDELEIIPGFIVKEDAQAVLGREDGRFAFLLNPYELRKRPSVAEWFEEEPPKPSKLTTAEVERYRDDDGKEHHSDIIVKRKLKRSREAAAHLLASACHEACHIVDGDHSTAFANALTDVLERVDQAAAIRRILAAWR